MATKLTKEKKGDLRSRMIASSYIKETAVFGDSDLFKNIIQVPTDLPILNLAFSGHIDGGFSRGVNMIAGESKNFKSLLGIFCVAAYLKQNPDGICLFYDNEFGSPPEYWTNYGIDISRVIHIPITNIEEMLFDVSQKIEEITKEDKVIIFVDSLGNLASKKEAEDAVKNDSKLDMTRAKSLNGFFRIVTPKLVLKDIPFICINHIYKTTDLFAKTVISGGQKSTLAPNSIFIISKAQEKNTSTNELLGWNFMINIEKSRSVKEKSKFPFQVLYGHENGINKYSGMLDLAVEFNFVAKVGAGVFAKIDQETGEVSDVKYKERKAYCAELLDDIIANPEFRKKVSEKYKLVLSDTSEQEAEEELKDDEE